MRRLVVTTMIAAAAVVGCSGVNLAEKAVGSWKIDPKTLKGPTVTKEIYANAGKIFGKIRIQLKQDGTYFATGIGPDDNGKWILYGDTFTLTSVAGDKGPGKPTMVMNSDGTRIHMVFPAPASMELDLVKE